jgi:hypothetical protein
LPGVVSPPEGEARLPAPLTEEELLSVCWQRTGGLRTYLENLANFLASFQDIRMEEGNLLTFEFPFRGLLERTLAALATEETGSVAKLRQGKQQVRLGLAADCLFAQVVLEPVRGSRRRFGLVLPEGRGPGLAALGVAGREGDLAW